MNKHRLQATNGVMRRAYYTLHFLGTLLLGIAIGGLRHALPTVHGRQTSAATRKPQFDDALAGVFEPLAATR
jgi:hypothetical protein